MISLSNALRGNAWGFFCTAPQTAFSERLMISFYPLQFSAFFCGEKKLNDSFFLTCWFQFLESPAAASPSPPSPIFNRYETSNYAAIQVAFHQTQCCPLEHRERCSMRQKDGLPVFRLSKFRWFNCFFPSEFALFQSKSHFCGLKCILIDQIRHDKFSWKPRAVLRWNLMPCVVLRGMKFCALFLSKDKAFVC